MIEHDALAARPHHRGLPVPYIALWGSERGPFTFTRDHAIGALYGDRSPAWVANTPGREGRGVPDFATMHPGRQRQVILDKLCQVCAQPLEPGRVWMIAWGQESNEERVPEPVNRLRAKAVGLGLMAEATLRTEPPLCAGCAAYTLTVCPGVAGKERDDPAFAVLRLRWWHPVIVRMDPWAGPWRSGECQPPNPGLRSRMMRDGGALLEFKIVPGAWHALYQNRDEAAAAATANMQGDE